MLEQERKFVPEKLRPYSLKAVIWDKDGPLMDTEPFYFTAILKILGQRGVSGYDCDEHRKIMGLGGSKIFAHVKKEYELTDSIVVLRNEYRNNYYELMREGLKIQDGVDRILCELEEAGVSNLVATGASKKNAYFSLKAIGIYDRFSEVVSAEDVARGKPYPDIFLETARRAGVMPEHCLVIGDSWNDLLGAKRAGMKMVLLSEDRAEPTAGMYPDLIVGNLKELNLGLMTDLWKL